jgi:hypothetical protein
MARAKRAHDTRISGAKACGVQHLGPSLTHEWHTAGNVGGVRLPRDVQRKEKNG